MATPILPTLNSTVSILTNMQEITATVMQYMMYNPGDISSTHEDELVSFRKLAAMYGDNRDQLCEMFRAGTLSILRRYFPDHEIIAEFTASDYEDIENNPRYTITCDITYKDKDGNLLAGIEAGTFNVDSENRITLNFGNGS